jgi:hypothetical protein
MGPDFGYGSFTETLHSLEKLPLALAEFQWGFFGHVPATSQCAKQLACANVLALRDHVKRNAEEQPPGLIVWTSGGATLGATSAGVHRQGMEEWPGSQEARGNWCLVEEDRQNIPGGKEEPRRLILNGPACKERVGDRYDVRGACGIDPLTAAVHVSYPFDGPSAAPVGEVQRSAARVGHIDRSWLSER